MIGSHVHVMILIIWYSKAHFLCRNYEEAERANLDPWQRYKAERKWSPLTIENYSIS